MGMLSLKSKIMVVISNLKFFFGSAVIMFAVTPIVSSFKLTESNKNKPVTPHWDYWEPLCVNFIYPDDNLHEYLFSNNETIDWNSAREMCELLGGYLVRIDNRHENNCLLNYTQHNEMHQYWWTSGNDIRTEGLYEFEDGTEMKWVSNWAQMDGESQDGVVLSTHNSVYAGSWADGPITNPYHYICERN